MQMSLTPALESIMSQCSFAGSQTGGHLRKSAKQVWTKQFPKLSILTCNNFWQQLALGTPEIQTKSCTWLNKLCQVALQRSALCQIMLTSDLGHVLLQHGESDDFSTIAQALNGNAYFASSTAIAITAEMLCFAFSTSDCYGGILVAKHFAHRLGLPQVRRRLLF